MLVTMSHAAKTGNKTLANELNFSQSNTMNAAWREIGNQIPVHSGFASNKIKERTKGDKRVKMVGRAFDPAECARRLHMPVFCDLGSGRDSQQPLQD